MSASLISTLIINLNHEILFSTKFNSSRNKWIELNLVVNNIIQEHAIENTHIVNQLEFFNDFI